MLEMVVNKSVHIYLIFIVTIVLFYNYSKKIYLIDLELRKPKYNIKIKTPYSDTRKHDLKLNYSKLIDIDFKFLIKPRVCSKNQPVFLMIVISSEYYHQYQRNIIRDTWGRANDAIKIVFAVGINNIQKDNKYIISESKTYKDIVQGNFVDTYRNLTYKFMMELKWVTHHCPTARYILKTDDDIFVNHGELMKFLVRELSPWGVERFIACMTLQRSPVLRKKDTQWTVTKEEYAPEFYPTYCMGAFILFSQDVIPYLLEKSQTTKYLSIDDAYVTGILANDTGIPRTDLLHLYFYKSDLKKIWKWGVKAFTRKFIFGPILSPVEMQIMWQLVPARNE